MHHTRRLTIVGTALATMALTFSSIGVVAQDASPEASPAAAVGVPTVPTGYAELDQALGEDQPFTGTRVTMQTQWIAGEGDNFSAALAGFEAATGIDVTVAEVPSGQHETLVNVSLNGGAAADIIQLAQPAAILEYGAQGLLVDIGTMLDSSKLAETHPATLPLYTGPGGEIWGQPYKVDVKSVVWYPINAFAEAGYAVPTTWDELIALSDQIVADGSSPWCVGMDAAAATGWIATDMIEDIMLRTAGVEAYNAWAALELPFSSPEVKNAFDLAGQIYFTPDYVLGGSTAILATAQTDAMDPMFDGDLTTPSCWMQKQATWYGPDFFPDQKATGSSQFVVGEDVGLFYFPPIDPALGNPALGAGDAFMVTADRPEVRAVLQFLATPEGIQAWIDAGSAISANQSTSAEWYAGNYKLEIASGIVADATSFGFDASDLMPASGAAFWAGVVDWISNDGTNTDAVLQAIDDGMAQ
ncbi:ABC transporter substrate-binding protein [soil metagenome]